MSTAFLCKHDCEMCKMERDIISKDFKKLSEVYEAAKTLIDSGYDGPFMGCEVEELFRLVRDVES